MTAANIGIYLDSDVCRWHIDQFNPQITKFFNLNEYVNSNVERKIAMFHTPFPYEYSTKEQFEQRVNQVLNTSNNLIVMTSELHDSTVDFINRFQDPKIKHIVCGTVKNIEASPWLDWFTTSTYMYKNNPVRVLDRLNPYQPKPKFFDILLGMPKPHRDIIYNYVNANKLNDRMIMTYLGHPRKIIPGTNSDGWVWEDEGLEILNPNINWTVDQVKYYGQEMSLSQVVPINIYNQTAYSLVAETNFANHYVFHTEKIVKPILARRLFLVYSGQHYLKNLKNLGFKTFSEIIDESLSLIHI